MASIGWQFTAEQATHMTQEELSHYMGLGLVAGFNESHLDAYASAVTRDLQEQLEASEHNFQDKCGDYEEANCSNVVLQEMVALATKENQELATKNKELTERIAVLEAQLNGGAHD